MTKKTKIFFRPMNEEDLESLHHWFACFEDIALFDRGLPVPVSRQYIVESWKPALQFNDPPKALWFITEDADGNPVGVCGVQAINFIHGDAVIPMFVSKEYRCVGLASAMLLVLLELAFGQLRLHRVSTIYRSDNEASRKLLSATGFAEEGRTREGWYADGQHHDIIHVGLLRSEWSDNRQHISERLTRSPFELIKRPRNSN
ncbi:MAG: GNAT family protein [Pseudomonadota bacterium]